MKHSPPPKATLCEAFNWEAMSSWIEQYNPKALMADGFNDAIVGVAERCGQPALIVYDARRCIEILARRDGNDTR